MGTIELYGILAQTPTGHLLFPHTFQQRSSRGPETGLEEIAFAIYLNSTDLLEAGFWAARSLF